MVNFKQQLYYGITITVFDSLWIDIATARTEFYPYPAANPEVEASSIRQDLYRRDFTINALALRLTSPQSGELLDFFGGIYDLQNRLIRVSARLIVLLKIQPGFIGQFGLQFV
jgi:tRNA nucleotidyltransferase/poly(A) polymerase